MGETAKNKAPSGLLCALYSKREGAQLIAGGTMHLHSSTLSSRDPYAKATAEMLATGKITKYPWETENTSIKIQLNSSTERKQIIREAISTMAIEGKRDLCERTSLVLEELLTNAIFHSYLDDKGEQKYLRQNIVTLNQNENVTVEYAGGPRGLYLCVSDNGGTLQFDHIAQSFQRCYGEKSKQIQTKASGAGLGLYMVFEMVTHLKILCTPGKRTVVSCWLSDNRSFDPDSFSFNFFDGRAP